MPTNNPEVKRSTGLGKESKVEVKQQQKHGDATNTKVIFGRLAREAKEHHINSQLLNEEKYKKSEISSSEGQNNFSKVSISPTQPLFKPVPPKREPMIEIVVAMDKLYQIQSLEEKDKRTVEKIIKDIATLQSTFNEANRANTQILKKKFIKEKKSIKKLLNSLNLSNEDEIKFRTAIIKNLRKLEGQVLFTTEFDDRRIYLAKKSIKKETGANPGYTITNSKNTRFTVKQGKTVGNTLSEVFASMVLSEIVQASGAEDKSQVVIANAFLAVKKADDMDKSATIEQRCKKRLYAASQWTNDRASFETCQLFGLKERKKAAGTRQVEDFEYLRQLNAECGLGLEKIVIPTALIADFDLHTENFMLKINDRNVEKKDEEIVDAHLLQLKKAMEIPDRKRRLESLKININILKGLGVKVFFHKIDHDSGFYRYADPRRIVDFLTHYTSPIHRKGLVFTTQPTLHITEITGGTREGMDQLLLSSDSTKRLLEIDLIKELKIVSQTAGKFFEMVHKKSEVIEGDASKDNENQRVAEFYLLNEFYHHIKEERRPAPKKVTVSDINYLKRQILEQLAEGTKLKITDLHTQVYKRLLEKANKKEALTGNQLELIKFLEEQPYIQHLIPNKGKGLTGFKLPPRACR